MTVRARPVVRQSRAPWKRPDRRNFFLNVGFGLVVVIAIVVLLAAAGVTYYDQHLAPVASVNGQSITKDEYLRRGEVEVARLAIARSRILDEFNAGRLTEDQRAAQLQVIDQREQQLGSITLERLIDARIGSELAQQEGVAITDADVEAFVTEEATRPERRFAWIIEVAPTIEADAEEPTEAAKTEAKTKAETALADLKGGKDWVEVANAVSTDSTRSVGGELGWVTKDFDPNQAFSDAVFTLASGAMTELLVDDEGVYRIGRVTEIVAARVEPNYRALITDRGAPAGAYDEAARQDVLGEKLREKIEAQALAAGPQRRVAEIYLENQALPEALPEGSVKTRHILYSPKDDPNGAEEIPAEDPSWKEAEDAARKAFTTLQATPEKFDELARAESDEGGADISGGKLPWFDPSQVEAGQLDRAFGTAIFTAGLQAGQVLEPVKSAFGWHVIQVLYHPTDEDQAARLKAQIETGSLTFEDAALDYSAGAEAAEKGEIGWVARYQLDLQSEEAIFATAVGSISNPVVVDGDGVHLYKVLEEQTRTPEGEQKDAIEQSAFANWYEAKKAAYTIDRELSLGAG